MGGILDGLDDVFKDPVDSISGEVKSAVDGIQNAVKDGAKSLDAGQVDKVLQSFTEDAKQLGKEVITEQGQQYVAAIEELKEKFKELQDQLDIEKIKREILGKAEEFCEAYLREKVSLPEDLPIKTHPRVILDFDLSWIDIKIEIFVMKQEDPDKSFKEKYLVAGDIHYKQMFNEPLQVPDFGTQTNPNLVQNEMDRIKDEIDKQKERIIAELVASIMGDYVPPLKMLSKYLKIF
ncbi:hypothetical protein ACTFO4_06590 [Bacillus cereus group sp. MYBKT14-1]|uniref:hypothetical protein n=1 Tax=Bacillus cereus group TaxID=86661 RepID=UPI00211BED56|nr:hypothetical protein [Bacillus cereus]UUN19509.1 hypothetical protein LRS65_10405 [Bacillus cereus]